MPERKRNIQLHFMVSESERAQIRENMKRLKRETWVLIFARWR
jgi:hypothetical protein